MFSLHPLSTFKTRRFSKSDLKNKPLFFPDNPIFFTSGEVGLANELATALNLKSFDVEPTEYPPHENIGTTEAFGWEAWLKASFEHPPYNFHFEAVTEGSIIEEFKGRMHNLSPWMARLLESTCDVEAVPKAVEAEA